MQRRWEEQLAGYVRRVFATFARQHGQVSRCNSSASLLPPLILYFGAMLVIEGSLTVGELVAFNMLAGRVSRRSCGSRKYGRISIRRELSVARLGDILNSPAEPSYNPARGGVAADPRRDRDTRARELPLPARRPGSPARCELHSDGRAGSSALSVHRAPASKHVTKLMQRLYVPESGRVLVDGIDIALVDVAWLRRQIGVVCRRTSSSTASIRDNIALCRSRDADGAGHRGGQARRRA